MTVGCYNRQLRTVNIPGTLSERLLALIDSQADVYALAWQPAVGTGTVVPQGDPLREYDRGAW